MNYQEYLQRKRRTVVDVGFDVPTSALNDALFDFQKVIVQTALSKGRYAIFADCGLGKTLMQLEWSRHVVAHSGKPVLILAPLAVSGQTIEEGDKFGIRCRKYFDQCELKKGDCVQLIKTVESDSVGFSIFSPPFASLYTYSDKLEDMGNCENYADFVYAFQILVDELFRVMWNGRNVAVHCMDLPINKSKAGYIGLYDFSGTIRECFEKAGFIYHSRVTIWKDPVTEMQRTKALGLLHKQVKKDAAMSRVGIPDYLLVFRKPGDHLHPVRCEIPVDTWQKYASPVWYDINYSNTLNGREGRSEQDEKHICPLQLETIERSIHLWSNEGDTVLTPFAGIGSEVYQALRMRRRAIGFELKDSYFDVAVKNAIAARDMDKQQGLFTCA